MAKFKLFILFFFFCSSIGAHNNQKNDSTYLKETFPKQESRSSLIFSGELTHFQEKPSIAVAADGSNIDGYYLFPLNPGIGLFYQYQADDKNYFLVGVNYRMCSISSTRYDILRFRYREPSFSIGYKGYFLKREKIGLYSSISLSYGQTKLSDSEHYGHIRWEYINPKELMGYSNNDSFADLVFNVGILFPSNQIEIAPAIGYREKDNWMGYYRDRFFYGLTINSQLKFSKK
jgi:hypothetical protein